MTDSNERLLRLGRLTLKELREVLRDRRTIVTLVLMPLLMYPLIGVAFQQFFVSQLSVIQTPRYKLGFENERDGRYFMRLLRESGLTVVDVGSEAPRSRASSAFFEAGLRPELASGIEEYDIHVGLRLNDAAAVHDDPARDLAVDVELLFLQSWKPSHDAAAIIEKTLSAASERFLEARLKSLRVTQRAVPIRTIRRPVEDAEESAGSVSIAAVVPFILILMTVTGAVYPAIDLTAGERERGTLEMLVAAPIPRFGVLLAKYLAVLTVALLTAVANLVTMTITIAASGLGPQLFGESGISGGVIAAVFGLLLLFAAFFSAALLVVTSSARSFKEAQAYLIPLMLVSLAPGMLGLIPDIELSGFLLITPLANIVVLGRDLFALRASGSATAIVVASTLLYAGASIAIAARIFGAESVLYSSQSGWRDLFRPPREPQKAPTVASAFVCLALMFPAYFLFFSQLGGVHENIAIQQILGVAMTAIVFGGFPLAACRARRVPIGPAFRLPRSAWVVFAAAVLVGSAFWMLSHEIVLLVTQWRGTSIDPQLIERANEYLSRLRTLPAALVVLSIAAVPAFFEEAFFRGYLFAALRSRMTPAATIGTTAIVFGLFHVIRPNQLAFEQFLSSTVTGLVLGWVRWRTGSVLAGMLLHGIHNAVVILVVYYEPQLSARGIGLAQTEHLPGRWLIAGGLAVCAGLAALYAATRRERAVLNPGI